MTVSMTFDGYTFKDELTITDIRGRGILQNEVELINVAGKAGAYFSHRKIPVRIIEVDVVITGENPSELRKTIREINKILSVDEPKPISFSDDPEITYHGIPEQSTEGEEIVSTAHSTIVFVCADPFSYSPEIVHHFQYDVTTVYNNGSEEAEPIFELEVLRPVTFAMVQNQFEEYQMIGRPADVESEVVEERTLILEETGQTLDTWDIAPGSTGSFTTSELGIHVASYGTGSRWHGPALIKEIEPLEDFEIEFLIRVRTNNSDQTFRISTNYFDEEMNEIGMLRLWDNRADINRKVVEARVGPYVGDFINYPISSRNYDIRNQLVWYGLLRVIRKGNTFTFYAGRITQTGKHVHTITETFNDVDNKYSGRLRFVKFDIAKYGNTASATEIGIEAIRVYRHNKVEIDQTPYIAQKGDIIIFDHVNDEILINGENRKDIKDFGGSYFTLKRGENQLVIHPSDSFSAKVRYRETNR